ncbi:MAG TPA: adenosylcobinamide-phosphate synthase CbiB [Burkholderiaceae bacterium]|nr:adenosylcobinamide-phosphate synthase CbiB [Burkholderiaceae bacterium]
MREQALIASGALALAWWLDTRFGEPRNAWHPVAWLGACLTPLGRPLAGWSPVPAFVGGAALWLATVCLVGLTAAWLQRQLLALPTWAGLPLLALALKPAFAWRMLRDEVTAVEAAFTSGLPAARERLSRLCSRDVSVLDATAVRETAIETLAENLNDSLVAPLVAFALGGLPGAWIWRAVNTMDAMWGYRGRWEWAGKWAARADDLLAWAPARLAALLLWHPRIKLSRLRREAQRTPSPNGGWPMAAMALRLDVHLGKPGVYVLHADGEAAQSGHVAAALRVAHKAAALALLLAMITVLAMGGRWS